MTHLKTILLFGLLFFTAPSLWAKVIPFSIDAAQFRYDSERTLWEMYYSLPDTSLTYTGSASGQTGELYIKTTIFSSRDTAVRQEWIISNVKPLALKNNVENLVGQKGFALLPGQYTVEIEIRDLNDTSAHARSSFPVNIRKFESSRIALSDLELATAITKENVDQVPAFKKGVLAVMPNPSLEYIDTLPELKLYAEVYNLPLTGNQAYMANYTVFDAAKREVFSVPLVRNYSSDAIVETVTLPMDIVPTGAYFVQLTVYSPAENPVDSLSVMKKFYILNPNMKSELDVSMSEDQMFALSEFATMNPERLNSEIEKIRVIASLQEMASFNSLSEHLAQQKFIYRFWAIRDPKQETPVNEALETFRDLVNYANTYYSSIQSKEGWKSDRGRVLLKYGKPSEVNRSDYNVEGRPYETWLYNNVQGGVEFNFVDMSGHNNYKLVHSTAIGEVRDYNWQARYVRMNSLNPDNGR
ncbi:MAG TPA: GWxTD domain-containing protein [Patescibacteria group bacterium]|nr:GWxTD domain-containing protein [Patescibacteria group bacterium]